MRTRSEPLPATLAKVIASFGASMRRARLRRNLSMAKLAEGSGISRPTLDAIESGEPGVSIGHVIRVLGALGLESDFLDVGRNDAAGREMQDAGLPLRSRPDRHQDAGIYPYALYREVEPAASIKANATAQVAADASFIPRRLGSGVKIIGQGLNENEFWSSP